MKCRKCKLNMAKMSIAVFKSFTTSITFSRFARYSLVQTSAQELLIGMPMRKSYQVRVQSSICYRYARLLDIVQYAVGYFENSLIDDILI